MTNLFAKAVFTGIALCQECALVIRVGLGLTAPCVSPEKTACMEDVWTGLSNVNATVVSKENHAIFLSAKLAATKQGDIAQLLRLVCAKTVGAVQTVLSAFVIGTVSMAIASTPGNATVFQDFLGPLAMIHKAETEIGEDGANGRLAQGPALEAAPEKG